MTNKKINSNIAANDRITTAKNSLRVAQVFFNDVMEHIYGFETFSVIWGSTQYNQPAFQFSFDRNPDEMLRFDRFIQNCLQTDSDSKRCFLIEDNLVVFESLHDIRVFWTDFMNQNHKTNFKNEMTDIKNVTREDIEPDDLLKLRNNFYNNWDQCSKNINIYNAQREKFISKFVYGIAELGMAIETDIRNVKNNKDGSTNYILNFH